MKLTIESKGEFNKIRGWIANVVNKSPVQALSQMASEGEKSLARHTPKNTGETASGWVSEITSYRDNSVIEWSNVAHPNAGVNVARIIETGHGTGTGGYVPPNPYIKNAMNSVWRNSDDLVKELTK